MPLNPFVFRRTGLDTLPVSEGGMMSPFVTTGSRVGGGGFDSNIFTYGGYSGGGGGTVGGGVPGGIDGLGGNVGGGFDPDYQKRLDEEARMFFEKQKADEQARLDEEARLAKEAQIAEQARLDEEARVAALKKSTDTIDTITELPPVGVDASKIQGSGGYIDSINQNLYNTGLIGPANDPANLAANPNKYQDPSAKTFINPTDPIVPLEPFGVNETPIVSPTRGTVPQVPYVGMPTATTTGITQIPQYPVDEAGIAQMPPFGTTETKIVPPKFDIPPVPGVLIKNFSPDVKYPPITDGPPVKVEEPPAPVNPPSIPSVPGIFGGSPSVGTTTGGTGTGQNLTVKRDFGAELSETLAALQKNQPAIMSMYGDLYKQFMPKGITESESGIIDQYKADLGRLQQRQAGILAPEDVRQSQQAAREAYAARGQVMGPGAVGAEILNREAIRQQREDQARAGLQASYGNVLNMANLQTGNIFSPIGNLMSNTFNPLSPYAADVYGTNVNAQLAKEIAQKNYEAAVRSAELSGAAQNKAATTSAAGNILGPAIGGVVGKGLSAIFSIFSLGALSCMPGDQCIDTPNGPKAIKDLKGGDSVIGYDGEVAFIAQACSWNQDPLRTFLTITREDGSSFTVCDDHKIMGIPAMEWVEGAEMAGILIKSIEESTGLLTSYDILTNQGGYRINGIPVNSMIPEIVMQVVEFHRQVDRNLQAIST